VFDIKIKYALVVYQTHPDKKFCNLCKLIPGLWTKLETKAGYFVIIFQKL